MAKDPIVFMVHQNDPPPPHLEPIRDRSLSRHFTLFALAKIISCGFGEGILSIGSCTVIFSPLRFLNFQNT